MTNTLDFMSEQLSAMQDLGMDFAVSVIGSAIDSQMLVDGHSVLNFCGNNYLGLANHPALKKAAREAIDVWGVGAGAVRYIAGTLDLHLELEHRLARFKGAEAALYVQTGLVANLSAIAGLVGKDDVVFSDRLNHASIVDGARLSGATTIIYEHCDMDDLQLKIDQHLDGYSRGLVVSDGVFSMDGDIAPVDKLYEIATTRGLLLMIDDAHGDGVLGGGRGTSHHFGLQGKIDVEVGTLSKAFGVIGGVIAGKKLAVDFINANGRAHQYSTATTPADTAACLAAVDLLEQSSELVDTLWRNTAYFKEALTRLGFDISHSQTPIVPIVLGKVDLAKRFASRLFEEGVFVKAQTYPLVPKGSARIRVMNSAAHSIEDLDRALAAFERVGRELGVVPARAGVAS